MARNPTEIRMEILKSSITISESRPFRMLPYTMNKTMSRKPSLSAKDFIGEVVKKLQIKKINRAPNIRKMTTSKHQSAKKVQINLCQQLLRASKLILKKRRSKKRMMQVPEFDCQKLNYQTMQIYECKDQILTPKVGTSKGKCGIDSKDMSKSNSRKQSIKSTKSIKVKTKNQSKKTRCPQKTLKINPVPTLSMCKNELKSLSWTSPINIKSKKIKKMKKTPRQDKCQRRLERSNLITPAVVDHGTSKEHVLQNWRIILLKYKINDKKLRYRQMSTCFKQMQNDIDSEHTKEILDLNEQHKQLMLREREQHCHLYNESANFESTKQKLHNQMVCTRDQRQEINNMLRRLAKYAPQEVKDYPKNLITNGNLDPQIWKLTREAATDEELIATLKSKLEHQNKRADQLQAKNQDFVNQINYASNQLRIISDHSNHAITNVVNFQNLSMGINFPDGIQESDPQQIVQPQKESSSSGSEEFQYCFMEQDEQINSMSNEMSSANSNSNFSVSFDSKETIIGKKIINPQKPKICSVLLPKMLAKSKALKKRHQDKIEHEQKKKALQDEARAENLKSANKGTAARIELKVEEETPFEDKARAIAALYPLPSGRQDLQQGHQ